MWPDRARIRWLKRPENPQQAYLQYAKLVLAAYIAFAVVGQIEVMFGVIEQRDAIAVTAFYLTGALVFVGVIRSGANQRFRGDPALARAQCLFAIVVLCWAYALNGPARGAVLSVMGLIMVFGMFALNGAQAGRISAFALTLLGAVMVWKSKTDPLRFPPAVELTHFLFASVVLLSIALLAGRLARLRERLSQQNAALTSALEQIQRLATQDDLTGLVNRRHMSDLLAAENLRRDRSGESPSLVLIDIDLFKRINDEHGHAAGDAVLRRFAEVAAATLRASDVLARWGGEEFLLLLPATDEASALLCVERIRARLAEVSFDAVRPGLRITFSAGLSVLGPGETAQTLVERADRAMYAAKRAGRNCTVTC